MPQPVVHLLEVVDVHHEDADALVVALCRRAGGHELLLQVASVGQPGEEVRAAHGVELGVALAELVLEGLDPVRGAHTGQELSRLERLAQVVVGTEP